MKVDAVIPAYKPGHDLRELIEKLLDQTVGLGRIIIINTDREFFDEKEYLIAPVVEVVHITRHEFDHAGTRDMGLRMSDADYVLFMTMDAVPKDKYLVEKLLSGFGRADNIAVSYARQLPKKDCNRIEQITREFNYPAQSRVQTSDDIEELGIKRISVRMYVQCTIRQFTAVLEDLRLLRYLMKIWFTQPEHWMQDMLFRIARTHLCIIPIITRADNITDVILTLVYRRPIIRRYLNVLMLKEPACSLSENPWHRYAAGEPRQILSDWYTIAG